jgi:hypothetical protein
MAFVSSASRGNNPVKGRARSLFIPDRNYRLTKYLADADGGSKRILPSRQTAGAGISRICRKIDSRVKRPDRHPPPGYGSEPHLDFIVTDLDGMLAHLCGPDRKIIRSGINKFPTVSPNISRRRRRIQENFAEQADCWSGISRICRKIDSRVNVRIDTQPPGYGSEPHLDFIVTDLDGMLARLCGPDRKIIRLRDNRGIYLFLIEITAITKYLAAPTADPGEF